MQIKLTLLTKLHKETVCTREAQTNKKSRKICRPAWLRFLAVLANKFLSPRLTKFVKFSLRAPLEKPTPPSLQNFR